MQNLKTNNLQPSIAFYCGKYPPSAHTPKTTDFSIVYIDAVVNLGVISRRAFETNQIVAEIQGELVTDIRQHTLQIGPNRHLYDPYFSGYISHSCDPNIRLESETCLLIAIKDIAPQERLCMDYTATEDTLFHCFQCNCGSVNCRGWIQGKKQVNRK